MPLNYVLHIHHLNFVALKWRYYFARLWERGQGPAKCYFWDVARWSLWTITSRPTTVKIWTRAPPSQVQCCVAEGGLGFAMVTNNPQISVVWDTKVYFSLTVQNFPRQLSSVCWLSIPGYLNLTAFPYQHTLPWSPGQDENWMVPHWR